MLNNSFDILQQPRIQGRIDKINSMQDEASRLILIKKLFVEIQNASKSIVDEIGNGVAITNLDEVTTAIHNETTRNGKILITALKDLKLSNEKQNNILSEVMKDAHNRLDDEFQTIKIRKSLDKVHVLNAEDFPVAEEVDIKNWPNLEKMFDSLEKTVKDSLKIKVEAPQVNVEAPVVNVEAPDVNFPEMDFEPLIQEVKNGLQRVRQNKKSNPLFVSLNDVQDILTRLDDIREASKNVMLGFPGIIGIRGIDGGLADTNNFGLGASVIASKMGDNSQTVVTSGTRVQLSASSIPCKWIVVVGKVTNNGTIYLGGITIAVGRGVPLVQLQSQRLDINNLNQVYIDGDTSGDGVTFCYGS